MATLAEYNRITFSGAIATQDVWSTSINCADLTGGTSESISNFADLQTWADAIGASLTAVPTGLGAVIGDMAKLATIRVESRTSPTNLLQAAEFNYATPLSGGLSSVKPPQVACVASLITGQPGRSYKGRMYFPATAAAINTVTGRLTTSVRDAFATAVADLITGAIAGAPGALSLVPVVVSATKSEVTAVTSIRVGDVLDTQRRRRDELAENYFSVTV